MYRSSAKRLSALVVSIASCFFLTGTSALFAAQEAAQAGTLTPKVHLPVKHGLSVPLRDAHASTRPISAPPREAAKNERPTRGTGPKGVDPLVQREFGISAPAPILNFNGVNIDEQEPLLGFRLAPPDTNGDVGINEYFQITNSAFKIFNKNSGALLAGPVLANALFSGFGGLCDTGNVIDPIVLYDQLASRWFVSWIGADIFVGDDFHQCIAVSTSSDPLGTYNLYDYGFGTLVNDYPKFGIWPDAYYMTINQFDPFFIGVAAFAFDRAAMIAGLPLATAISFDLSGSNPQIFAMLPADLEGANPPPADAPNYMAIYSAPAFDGLPEAINIWEFHVDFAVPANSTFSNTASVTTTPVNPDLCGFARDCIPELDGEGLDAISGQLLHRLVYRNFGTHEVLLANQSVNVAPVGDQAGVRWTEIRDPGGSPSVFQAGTYAPDAMNRWMGSIAMDGNGNIALGYSISDATIHPKIGITGRLAADPPNTMGAEDIWYSGTGSQVATQNRWGDYSHMAVDSIDDCTFWYTTEHYDTTGSFDWNTRIGSFKFPSCTSGPSGTLEGTVTDGTNPIPGATVTANLSSTTTDAAGHYSFTLPVGTYDMTASKFGYAPATADDVPVTDGGTTTQNFVLVPAPTVLVTGIVTDGSGGDWPLYARIEISAPGGFPGAVVYTDPVTGYYEIALTSGVTYTFLVTAVSPGYNPGGGSLPVPIPAGPSAPEAMVANWVLTVNVLTCNAPGYEPGAFVPAASENFDAGVLPPGWTIDNFAGNGTWHIRTDPNPCGEPNMTGGTGGWAEINSDCDGEVLDDAALNTPSLDLSGLSNVSIQFNTDYRAFGDVADVDVSINGGSSWTNIWKRTSDTRGPRLETADASLAAGESDVKFRFHNSNAFFAWWWQVDNVLIGEPSCIVQPGGLVVGNVRDANTGAGLNGATVKNLPGGEETTTFATPEDPNQDDGLYILFAESGPQPFEASSTNYAPQTKNTTVVPNSTVRLDFDLEAGLVDATPRPLEAKVNPGEIVDKILTITNSGSVAADFEVLEVNVPVETLLFSGHASKEDIEKALARIPEKWRPQGTFSTRGLPPLHNPPQASRPLVGGTVLATYPASFASPAGLPYGAMFNTDANNLWVSNLNSGFPGDNMDYGFLADGTETGETIDMSSLDLLPVDGTYNQLTGMLWQATNDFFGGTNTCIYEISPVTKALTGNTICPLFASPQTGLAHDPGTDTYYSGSFFDGVINHFDSTGTILDSASVGLDIAGMAFNPSTGHLFVFQQQVGAAPDDVYVFDPAAGYTVVGSFLVGPPGIGFAAAGGAELDCEGHLWLIDQLAGNPILVVESGEEGTNVCAGGDIPWLSGNPTSGTVPANSSFPVTETFDSTGLRPGLRQAQLKIKTDTPYTVDPVPVNFTVRFLDVPDDVPPGTNPFENYIYAAAGAGIMAGSPYPGCHPGELNFFCPSGLVTRADMAGYIWRSVHGAFAAPPVYTGIFSDVLFNDYNANYIQGVHDDGITAGCQGPGQPLAYCPDAPITRAQMTVFIEKGVRGSSFVPPACIGIFVDVPCPATPAFPYSDWVEQAYNDQITVGCNTSPLMFCPDQFIPNEQMAVFIVKAFEFPILP